MIKDSDETWRLARTGHTMDAAYARYQGEEVYVRVTVDLSLGEAAVNLAFAHQNDFDPAISEKLLTRIAVSRLRTNDFLTHEPYDHPSELSQQLTDRALIAVNLITADIDENGVSYDFTEPFENVTVLPEYYASLKRHFPTIYFDEPEPFVI